MGLPLHAFVTALNHTENALDESFDMLGSVYALYPWSSKLLDDQRRPPLFYALEQRWGLEKLSWLLDKSLPVVLEKDTDGLALITYAITNDCPEQLVIRLAVAAASSCIVDIDELLAGQHYESARRPLTYQWFVQIDGKDDGTPIEGATQPFIFLSPSIQPHNEGIYYCEVVNRRGRVVSTRMTVRVVDDRLPPDPTLSFVVERTQLAAGNHTLRCLKASTGGRVRHLHTDTTVMFQPDFFTCFDRDGINVSDTHGVEIAISRRVNDESRLRLRHGESLVSALVEVMPNSMGSLLRPALLWLPHYLVTDTKYSAVVVEIDKMSRTVLRDVPNALVCGEYVRVPITQLGTFAVISRRRLLRHDESSLELPLERVRLLMMRPSCLSACFHFKSINVIFALVHDIQNCCSEAIALLRSKAIEGEVSSLGWTIDSFKLNARENFSLNLRIGERARVVFRWPPPTSEIITTHVKISLENSTPRSNLSRVSIDRAFVELPIRATVLKTPVQTRTRVNTAESSNSQILPHSDSTIFEEDWTVLIPVKQDLSSVFSAPPRMPRLLERTKTHLVLDLNTSSASASQHDDEIDKIEDVNTRQVTNQSMEENTYSPYFYTIEMAIFSPTFWRRYDQTWWFDKTKTSVIDGMYKVVHRGFGTKVTIFTSAYAGCVRVARCSIDCFGAYSEPLLLTPLPEADLAVELPLKPGKLFGSYSVEMEETIRRLQQLMNDLQIGPDTLKTVYGLARSVTTSDGVVVALLEAKRSFSSCNFELALLLAGFNALERQISQINVAKDSYATLMGRFLRVQRAVPELDYDPIAALPITRRLHALLRVTTLGEVFKGTAEVLANDAATLQCSAMLRVGLEETADWSIPWSLRTARSYLLAAVGRLQEAPDQTTKLLICRELCHALQLHPHKADQQEDDKDENIISTTAELLSELESSTSQQALTNVRQQDCLANHLVCVTPKGEEKCTRVPEAVHFDLDSFVRGVKPTGIHLIIRVANVTLDSCAVQGKTTFCERTTRLSFVPAAGFERKSRYRVTVREHELLSSLGGTLPERSYTTYFSTPA
ncbi:unnamed protein product [Phytophthora lilii]|uniref:Unnamed protein product n=1 Tax=Phytophthora lilii TaxID=2077276 RepID=A0A9W6TD14_9STRA|nr:unnamed protein product [Phytophthora lilii]